MRSGTWRRRGRTSWVGAVVAALLVPGFLAAPAAGIEPSREQGGGTRAAGADGVLQACVNRRTGRIRAMTGARCRRGERRISWNRIGPAGPVGPAGGTLQVADGSGAVVPNVVNVGYGGVQVLVGSGIYDYAWDGRLAVNEYPFLYYVGTTCSGLRLIPYANPSLVPGGPVRIVVRNPDSSVSVLAVGPVQTLVAGTVASTYVGSPPTCMVVGPTPTDVTVSTFLVDPAPRPPDLPGPLRLTLT